MAVNRGKKFEDVIEKAFEKVPNTSVVRLHDQTTGYLGSTNHCDFIVYNKPFEYHIECKSVHGNTLSIHSIPKQDRNGKLRGFYGNITDKQWEGLLEKSKIPGVIAGVICWWIDKDITKFIPIETLQELKSLGYKSVRYDTGIPDYLNYADSRYCMIEIKGNKKRVFFEYDMQVFVEEVNSSEYNKTKS
jgi:hypothetical protein